MNTITVTLPWPPAECSPNWRGHWAVRYKAVKVYRWQGWEPVFHKLAWLDECGKNNFSGAERLSMQYTFNPPTSHKRDDDNFIARMKAARDGICDALGVDDSVVTLLPVTWGEVTPGGEVVITIGLLEDE